MSELFGRNIILYAFLTFRNMKTLHVIDKMDILSAGVFAIQESTANIRTSTWNVSKVMEV